MPATWAGRCATRAGSSGAKSSTRFAGGWPMTPEQIAAAAQQAGIETGEVYPSDTAWRRRFVELVEERAITECERYLKDGESPARCIARNRGDVHSMLTLLAREKKRSETLREALSYYAESSNWRRDVHTVGLRKAWKKPNVASDRGGRARLALMTMEGSK